MTILVGGLDVFSLIVTADKTPGFMGIRERGQRGRLFVSEVAEPEEETWTFTPLDPDTARRASLYLKGAGESWFYRASTTTTGSKGTVPNAGGSYTMTSTNGPFSNARNEVASGSYVEIPTGEIGQGKWTVCVSKYETIADDGAAANAWYRYIVTGNATSVSSWYRNGVASGLATPANWLAMASDGDLQLQGKDSDASSNAKYYSGLEVVPFQVLSSWATNFDLAMSLNASPGLPFLNLLDYGDNGFEPENSITPIVVACRVNEVQRTKFGGAYQRVLRVLVQHRTSET